MTSATMKSTIPEGGPCRSLKGARGGGAVLCCNAVNCHYLLGPTLRAICPYLLLVCVFLDFSFIVPQHARPCIISSLKGWTLKANTGSQVQSCNEKPNHLVTNL